MGSIAALADAVWADSAFNAQELAALGVQNVRVLPLLFSPTMLEVAPDSAIQQRLATPSKKILFVGRIAPNKCVEDLIEVFAWYHRHLERRSELLLIGSERSCPRYFAMLRMYTGELTCRRSFIVTPRRQGWWLLRKARICLSPRAAIKATACRWWKPCIRAYRCWPATSAVCRKPWMGGGHAFDDASPMELACLMHRLITPALAVNRAAAQQARIERLRARPVLQELRELFTAL